MIVLAVLLVLMQIYEPASGKLTSCTGCVILNNDQISLKPNCHFNCVFYKSTISFNVTLCCLGF